MREAWNGTLDWSKIDCIDSQNIQTNKGVSFENVIESLLKSQFREDYWVRTQQTNDGKKDFVHPNETNASEWLECKNYNQKLSINVISPTLIMAAIEDISRVYIYSRSPLNENALEDLCLYKQAQKRDIFVYDGILLENCIYLHKDHFGLNKFFPNIDSSEKLSKSKSKTPKFFYSIRDMQGNKLTSDYVFALGETFKLNIIGQSQFETLRYSIKLSDNKNSITYSTVSIDDSLGFGELKMYTIVCQAMHAGTTSLCIKITANKHSTQKLNRKIVINDEPYCFFIPKWLKLKDECLSLLSTQDNPIILHGASGTGKSSLLKQISQDLKLKDEYILLHIDPQFECVSIMDNLIVQIVGLRNERYPDSDILIESEKLAEILSPYYSSYEQYAEKISKMVAQDKPFLLVIDDIQSLSYPHITFIKTLKRILQKNDRKVSFLFALNNDIMDVESFLRCMCWDELHENVHCASIEIPKFDKNDILNYFSLGYGITNVREFFSDFGKELSPLELSRFVSMLKQKRIIQKLSKDDGSYVITDNIYFKQAIEQFLYETSILSKIYASYDYSDYCNYLLKYVYLNGSINVTRVDYWPDMESLIAAQVFKRNGQEITFAHEKLRTTAANSLVFNNDDYAMLFFDNTTYSYTKAICAIAELSKLQDAKMFLDNYFRNIDNNLRTSERLALCNMIVDNIKKLHSANLGFLVMSYIVDNYSTLNDEVGRETFSFFLQRVTEAFLADDWWHNDENIAPCVCFLLKKYLDRILSFHKNENCVECARHCIKTMQSVTGLSEPDKNYWLCHFHNRTAIALMRLNQDSSSDYAKSYDYAKRANRSEDLKLQIAVDDFHMYYSYGKNLTEKIANDYLNKLESIVDRVSKTKTACINYHIALLRFLLLANNKTVNCDSKSIKEMADCVIMGKASAFYSLKMRLLKMYVLIFEKAYAEAIDLYFDTLEFAYNHEFRQQIHKLNFIYAHLLKWENCLSRNGQDFSSVALLSLKQLLDTKVGASANYSNDALREATTARRLLEMCKNKQSDYLGELSGGQKKFIDAISNMSVTDTDPQNNYNKLELRFNGILFPNC